MDRKEKFDEVSQEEFIEGVLSGGKRGDAMLELAIAASPAAARDLERARGPHRFVRQVQAFTAHGAMRAATFVWNCLMVSTTPEMNPLARLGF